MLGWGAEKKPARLTVGLVVGLVVGWPGVCAGQTPTCTGSPPSGTVYNPTLVCFVVSTDHGVGCPAAGAACVSGYRVEFWGASVDPATGAPVTTLTLARGAVTFQGSSTTQAAIPLSALGPVPAVPVGAPYVVRVVAVGDGGVTSARSAPSNPFAYPGVPGAASAVSIR